MTPNVEIRLKRAPEELVSKVKMEAMEILNFIIVEQLVNVTDLEDGKIVSPRTGAYEELTSLLLELRYGL